MSFNSIFLFPSKSAIVLATFKIFSYALTLNFSFSNAFCKSSSLFLSNTQNSVISFVVSSEFECIPYFLYLSNWIFLAVFTLSWISFEPSIHSFELIFSICGLFTSICISILSSNGPLILFKYLWISCGVHLHSFSSSP